LLILKNSRIKAWRFSFNSLSPFFAILIRFFVRKYSRRVGRMSVLDGIQITYSDLFVPPVLVFLAYLAINSG